MASRRRVWSGRGLGWGLGWGLGLSVGLSLVLSLGAEGGAQTLPGVSSEIFSQTLPQSSDDALHQMEQLAGVIFAGRVVAVRRHEASGGAGNGATGVVEIEFAVEDAVRGVSGGSYTLREWAGLWPGGDEPFRVGQRYLMLLHSPGPGGLSSPVDGTDGAIPIRGGGAGAGPDAGEAGAGGLRGAGPRDAVAGRMMANGSSAGGSSPSAGPTQADGRVVDLSWVATRVVRPVSYAPAPTQGSMARPIMLQRPQAELATAGDGDAAQAVGGLGLAAATAATPGQGAAYATVLGMLRSWERNNDGTR